MFLIEYFLYKIYRLFLNKTAFKKPIRGIEGACGMYTFFLFVNISSFLRLLGYPIWEKNFRDFAMICFVIVSFLLYYFYKRKNRIEKVYAKYKNESKFWKIFGWILIGGYIIATIYFMGYS